MIAKTPPMGWNSWDCYGAAVDEKTVRQNADYMAKHLKKFGWEYIVVDIQWYQPTADSHEYQPFAELTMDDYGRLLPAVNRFPSGLCTRPWAEVWHSYYAGAAANGGPPAFAHLRQPGHLRPGGESQFRVRLEPGYVRPALRIAGGPGVL